MRHHFARFLFSSLLVLLVFLHSAASQTVALYVSNYRNSPIKDVILSTKVGGSTSAPTDIAGKTRVVLPPGIQPGDSLDLSLVSAPDKKMRIVSPWSGRATVPKSTGFIEIVLGVPGDQLALQDPRVVASWAKAIVLANDNDVSAVGPSDAKRNKTLQTFSEKAGFTPEQIDSSIRKLAKSGDSGQQSAAMAYRSQYPEPPKTF